MSLFSFALLLLVLPAATLSQITTTPDDTKQGWQSGGNDRSSFDIIWACFTTIFACTWTVLHLNVSHPREPGWRIFWRQVKWFILTILIPEYLVAVAADQYWEARLCVKSFEKSKSANANASADTDVELQHSSRDPPAAAAAAPSESKKVECEEKPPRNLAGDSPADEKTKVSENNESNEIQQIPAKASAYADDWTLAHGFFTTMGGLAIQTEDEKEYSILKNDSPVKLLESGRVDFPRIKKEDIKQRTKADGFVKFIAVCQSTWFAVNVVARPAYGLHVTPLELATAAYVLCAVLVYVLWWHKPKDVTVPIVINVPSSSPDTTTNEQEPTLKYYLDNIITRKCNDIGGISSLDTTTIPNEQETRRMIFASLAGLFVALMYSGIHLAAWNFPFPTSAETKAWRICSVASISAAASLIPFYLYSAYVPKKSSVLSVLGLLDYVLSYLCYIIARIALMVLMLMSLRSLPTSCYDTVDWLSALPHY